MTCDINEQNKRLHRESPKRKQAKQNGRKYATEVQMKAELLLRVGDVICILEDQFTQTFFDALAVRTM